MAPWLFSVQRKCLEDYYHQRNTHSYKMQKRIYVKHFQVLDLFKTIILRNENIGNNIIVFDMILLN